MATIALIANIRLARKKNLTQTNAPAYFSPTKKKSFTRLTPQAHVDLKYIAVGDLNKVEILG
jgi:hypothetical protein